MGAELRSLLEQLFKKPESISKETEIDHSGSSGSVDLKMKSRVTLGQENRTLTQSVIGHINLTTGTKLQTKYSKLECPKFDGENFWG